ncbi:MAG TPA: helicase-related protein [Candidatus Ozemobacteraceae bacterium]|nr:helicase-related protein [Candidatus Ozemobacteraceae bacterium]
MPESRPDVLHLRPLGGAEEDAVQVYVPLESVPPRAATFAPPDPATSGSQASGLLLREALRLKLRAGAGPFRSFGHLAFEPRAYQLVPLLMALKLDPVRLLVADGVGIGKTIEAGLIVRELLDRGEIRRFSVICPPHLCEQWQKELASKFNLAAEVVRTGTASRLERGLPAGTSVFDVHPFTIVSLDYIKSDKRRDEFLRACPECIIVEEAHTCVQAGTDTRHQRFKLLKGLAENDQRHMIFLTATPHSGSDPAFDNLLALLNPRFQTLSQLTDVERRNLREQLAVHLVQRQRPDIDEWRDATVFPDRQVKEMTYALTGAWGRLFDDVTGYAREMVLAAEAKSRLHQRMSWWAALALLRCISSSPAAAVIALRTRLHAVADLSEDAQADAIDRQGVETVFDGEDIELLSADENVPAGVPETIAEASPEGRQLLALIERAEALRGPADDPKLAEIVRQVTGLVKDGFNPVIFCRYIATAHYVAEALAQALGTETLKVECVTGELASEQREEKVEALGEFDRRVLVATDCLSEGINLQNLFDAVVHYDLSWNPTRHEQREGRVDRFGQPRKAVRALMFYGANNPVDGAVLNVILRKAERIRKALGVLVPMPSDNTAVTQAIMKSVLLRKGSVLDPNQPMLDFGDVERQVETDWESAREKALQNRTIFAQRRLRPDDVLPEWSKANRILGGPEDVERFLARASERLGAPLEEVRGHRKFPIDHLPPALKDRLAGAGFVKPLRLSFRPPVAAGAEFIHRSHPLVALIADELAERALAAASLPGAPADAANMPAARCGAIFTQAVSERTVLLLLRLRCQITLERRIDGRYRHERHLLAEECLTVALRGDADELRILDEVEALALMEAQPMPGRNMAPEQRARQVQSVLDELPALRPHLDELARRRAADLLADHQRVREAAEAKGRRHQVAPCLPADLIGVYVLLPVASL